MANQVLLYISAALDLLHERDLLGRAATEVPVSLGWRIVQSPGGNHPVNLDAVSGSDVHLLLLGSDIRAPIGVEWMAARRVGRQPVLLLKQGILRTPAAQDFVRFVGGQAAWQPFGDAADLRIRVLGILADHILARAGYFALTPVELVQLRGWRSGLEGSASVAEEEPSGGAGEGGVILSPDRYVPSDGVLIRPREGNEEQSQASGWRLDERSSDGQRSK
jgi:hypothetical protein